MDSKQVAEIVSAVAGQIGGLSPAETELVASHLAGAETADVDVVAWGVRRVRTQIDDMNNAFRSFIAAHAVDFADTDKNQQALWDYLMARNLSITRQNLDEAFAELRRTLPDQVPYNMAPAGVNFNEEWGRFLDEHGDFFESASNQQVLLSWLEGQRLPALRSNLNRAYEACRAQLDSPRRGSTHLASTPHAPSHGGHPGSELPPLDKDFAARALAEQARARREVSGVPRNNDARAALEAADAARWADAHARNSARRRFR